MAANDSTQITADVNQCGQSTPTTMCTWLFKKCKHTIGFTYKRPKLEDLTRAEPQYRDLCPCQPLWIHAFAKPIRQTEYNVCDLFCPQSVLYNQIQKNVQAFRIRSYPEYCWLSFRAKHWAFSLFNVSYTYRLHHFANSGTRQFFYQNLDGRPAPEFLQFASCHFWQSVTLEKISHNIFAYSQNITLLKFKKESWDGWSSSSKPSKSAQ